VATLLLINRTKANAEALGSAFAGHAPAITLVVANASEARSLARQCTPDAAVIELDVTVGLRLVRDLRGMHPGLKIFVYGLAEDEREMTAWAEAGVALIVLHSVALVDLVCAVCDALRNGYPSLPTTARVQGSSGMTSLISARVGVAGLTQRERDVLQLISLGLSNREVAETLCLELPTVKNHVQHLMRKLGVHRRDDAVQYLTVEPSSGGPA
jgi:DNA-binding NarL/FixJ family response regulator